MSKTIKKLTFEEILVACLLLGKKDSFISNMHNKFESGIKITDMEELYAGIYDELTKMIRFLEKYENSNEGIDERTK